MSFTTKFSDIPCRNCLLFFAKTYSLGEIQCFENHNHSAKQADTVCDGNLDMWSLMQFRFPGILKNNIIIKYILFYANVIVFVTQCHLQQLIFCLVFFAHTYSLGEIQCFENHSTLIQKAMEPGMWGLWCSFGFSEILRTFTIHFLIFVFLFRGCAERGRKIKQQTPCTRPELKTQYSQVMGKMSPRPSTCLHRYQK